MDTIAVIPKTTLRLVDAITLIVGLMVSAGIFEMPALVAANTGTTWGVIRVWLMGGVVSLLGALCYAELATTYPQVGGNYYYLKRAFGQPIAVLFAWARMTVIQTGAIALLAFVFGRSLLALVFSVLLELAAPNYVTLQRKLQVLLLASTTGT